MFDSNIKRMKLYSIHIFKRRFHYLKLTYNILYFIQHIYPRDIFIASRTNETLYNTFIQDMFSFLEAQMKISLINLFKIHFLSLMQNETLSNKFIQWIILCFYKKI